MNKLYFEELFEGIPLIKPAKHSVPEWYGSLPRFTNDIVPAIRACVPFMDSFLTGYHFPLVADIHVTLEDGMPRYNWRDKNLRLVEVRDGLSMNGFPKGSGYYNDNPVWVTHHAIRIPKGYSALITHPLNRFDLPFTTLSGIVDDLDLHKGNLPFLLKEGFTGTIPQGTPIAQVLLFKRESWKLEKLPGLIKTASLNSFKSGLVFSGWYRKHIWKKKSYD